MWVVGILNHFWNSGALHFSFGMHSDLSIGKQSKPIEDESTVSTRQYHCQYFTVRWTYIHTHSPKVNKVCNGCTSSLPSLWIRCIPQSIVCNLTTHLCTTGTRKAPSKPPPSVHSWLEKAKTQFNGSRVGREIELQGFGHSCVCSQYVQRTYKVSYSTSIDPVSSTSLKSH